MPAFVYNDAMKDVASGSVNLATDPLKFMLITSAYTASKSDSVIGTGAGTPGGAEIVTTGYAGGFGGAGRLSAPRTIVKDATNNIIRVVFNADAVWAALGGASNATIAAAVLVKEITNDAGSRLVTFLPIGTTLNGTTTSGTPNVTGISSTAGIVAGMAAVGTGLPVGTTVLAITSGTAVTLSANATASGTVPIQFGAPLTTNGSGVTLTRDATLGNITFTL